MTHRHFTNNTFSKIGMVTKVGGKDNKRGKSSHIKEKEGQNSFNDEKHFNKTKCILS